MNYSPQIPQPNKRNELKEQALREVGKSTQMLRFIVGLSIVALFYLILLVYFLITHSKLSEDQSLIYSTAYGYIIQSMMTAMNVVIIALIIILLARLIPLIGCIFICKRSKNGFSASGLRPILTFLQVFGIIETIAWAALIIYEIIQMIKNGFYIPNNAGSTYYMILVVSVVTIICKLFQGIHLTKFITVLKRSIKQEDIIDKIPTGLKFSAVMLATCHGIILIFIVVNLLMALGISDFFKTFRYLWIIYLFLAGYIFSNYCLGALLNFFHTRMRLSATAAIPKTPNQYNTPNPSQNYVQQSYQNYQNRYRNYSQPQNQYPYQNYSQPQNQAYNQPQSQQPYQQNYSQPRNQAYNRPQTTNYPQNNTDTNTNNTSNDNPFEDMFGFNTHNNK